MAVKPKMPTVRRSYLTSKKAPTMAPSLPSSPSTPLHIAILGVGRIGSTFAFQLARTGRHDVTVVARPGSDRLHQLQRDGGIVNVKGEQAQVRITDTLDEQTSYDLVIVTLLAYQVEAVLPALQRSAARCIQFMFNIFEPERLRDVVGAERCAFGMPFVQANFDPEGRLKATIGAGGQKTLLSQPRWAEVFNAASLPATHEPDMLLWLRCHAPMCVAFESVSVAGERHGVGASWQEALVLARGMHASFALIKALGHPIYPRSKALLNGCPAWTLAAMLWTVSRVRSFRELLATGKQECCALVDAMLAATPRENPSVNASRIEAMKPL
ncbi:MAG: NAD(P)-binding domain-containing protein [Rhodospirillales bacterium]|nr:NAD(P)-binding domain-containing protein [Acetobacter sp.]